MDSPIGLGRSIWMSCALGSLLSIALVGCGGGDTAASNQGAGIHAPLDAPTSDSATAEAIGTKRPLAIASGTASVPSIAGNTSHSLALTSQGTVFGWGEGSFGQVGNNSAGVTPFPAQTLGVGGVGVLSGVTAIAAGASHSLALQGDGTVWSWGSGFSGELGTGGFGQTFTPVSIWPALTGVTQIVAGAYHSLALTSTGAVWSWGRGSDGQLGTGGFSNEAVPQQLQGLTGVAAVSAGGFHSFAVTSDGGVWAWGDGFSGQLGDGSKVDRSVPVRVVGPGGVGLLGGITAMAAGIDHSLALTNAGTVWAWGAGLSRSGQLGNGIFADSPLPVAVVDSSGTGTLNDVVAISAGSAHSLALKSDGSVWAWGYGEYGQLGNGANSNQSTPVQVSNLTQVTAIAAIGFSSLAIKSDGTVWAWGWGQNGKLGNGGTADSLIPVQVRGTLGVGNLNLIAGSVDTTPPEIVFGGNTGTYGVDESIRIDCTATDAESGVVSTDCATIEGPAYNFTIGSNVFTVNATDAAGNAASASTHFTVSVSTAGLVNLTSRFVMDGGVEHSLNSKLLLAELATNRGDLRAKQALLSAYAAQLRGMPARFISQEQAAVLVGLIDYL